ncbi:fumarylacetoacetate hydrolase family protein [Umezawaea tangerina]|uniref:2-keto-4-pentenoate hydratase/2-oxohepta-3-ene-1,7-dioic acid hydratase in catechol pathway n=1 Tax=Umezawaea tangerina TaxID=84725 RepID=A0A2T0TH30_9PSEU|nr:fumarylacetoacetate hydrolase family protein [Umezawaea tangerina]PRY45006.1 2-keto-4-pentenoate hydratase/2-oxohepta-3-ene-1,7-dioic acid hydratase in catechol pathway [Umezawaea tangerina]
MRLATLAGRAVLLVEGGAVDIATAGPFGPDPMDVLAEWTAFREWAASADLDPTPFDARDLDAPVPRPRQVFAVALNYPPHAAEAGYRPPADPLVFTKFPTCVTGPDAVVELPGDRVDWEVELVVVVGVAGHRIAAADAWDHVAGLTVGQDLSERRVQLLGTPPQFSLGKSFPGFGPTGPALVTPDELGDPDDLEITCLLNDGVVQRARTKDMIFTVAELVARLSAVCPLLPGDLVFTGTPAGVGNRMTPPRYLTADDVLVSRVEGIGELRTRFR